MEYATGLLVFIVLAMTGLNYYIKNKDVVVVESKIDGRKYRVSENGDSQGSADLLAEINVDILKLIDHLKSNSDEHVQRLCKRYNPDRLGENLEYKPYPIAAIMNDLDYYSSTKNSFKLLNYNIEFFLPRVYCYFDDTVGSELEMYNEFTGQLAAIQDFNLSNKDKN